MRKVIFSCFIFFSCVVLLFCATTKKESCDNAIPVIEPDATPYKVMYSHCRQSEDIENCGYSLYKCFTGGGIDHIEDAQVSNANEKPVAIQINCSSETDTDVSETYTGHFVPMKIVNSTCVNQSHLGTNLTKRCYRVRISCIRSHEHSQLLKRHIVAQQPLLFCYDSFLIEKVNVGYGKHLYYLSMGEYNTKARAVKMSRKLRACSHDCKVCFIKE
ncbi:hypothetical protein [Candidatus Sneabacter namystus]|uniref:SPOR domain-containing protein n=1 Tax=Candidatus Sneabacter namystus TaxID=2601646 RepID=A0A5C0UHF4_9RICK|nr:hypothetical protein [Candidatus Sneabacter namystus]QEK39575.1 hypothetical protein FZC37_01315 [Candidatus Sneabacter namystus]